MAEIVWTAPALQQLDAIAEYIALDNPAAASRLVQQMFAKVERLQQFPDSGRIPLELPHSIYREAILPPCRIFYRQAGEQVLILHIMRDEQQLRAFMLKPEV
jgi:toxin ParE1/3/4